MLRQTLILLLGILSYIRSDAQHWKSASVFSTTNGGSDQTTGTSDKMGNIFTGGFFWGTLVSIPPLTIIGSSISSSQGIIVKYDTSGKALWAAYSSVGTSWPISMSADTKGNLFVLGMYQTGSVQFGPIWLSSTRYLQYFLTKFDPNGNVLWSVNLVGCDYANASFSGAVTTDTEGNAYVTGTLTDTVTEIGSNSLKSNGGLDIFIAKYDPNGAILWAKNVGGQKDDFSTGISSTSSGDFYLTGSFASKTISFDTINLINNNYNNGVSVFLSKYDANGKIIWSRNANGNGSSQGVATDLIGNAYVVGYGDSIIFDKYVYSNIYASGVGGSFLVKYDPTGNVEWLSSIAGQQSTLVYSVAVDVCGNVWISGSSTDNPAKNVVVITYFGNIALMSAPGSFDPVFLAEYSSQGILKNAASLQSGGDDPCSIVVDPFGNAYLLSDFMVPRFNVGPDIVVSDNPYEDMYVAKYASDPIRIDTLYLSADSQFCTQNQYKIIDAPQGYSAYLWSNGQWSSFLSVDTANTYWVNCYDKDCISSLLIDTIHVRGFESFNLGNDTTICSSLSLQLPDHGYYTWQDGSHNSSFSVTETGTYFANVNYGECSFTDTIRVIKGICSCVAIMPTAFTPNEDGKNDFYYPIFENGCEVSDFIFSIYNRWGGQIFTTNDPSEKWDGKKKGVLADQGVYMYQLKYTSGLNHTRHIHKGDVTLVR